jgi:hypothetical protein
MWLIFLKLATILGEVASGCINRIIFITFPDKIPKYPSRYSLVASIKYGRSFKRDFLKKKAPILTHIKYFT